MKKTLYCKVFCISAELLSSVLESMLLNGWSYAYLKYTNTKTLWLKGLSVTRTDVAAAASFAPVLCCSNTEMLVVPGGGLTADCSSVFTTQTADWCTPAYLLTCRSDSTSLMPQSNNEQWWNWKWSLTLSPAAQENQEKSLTAVDPLWRCLFVCRTKGAAVKRRERRKDEGEPISHHLSQLLGFCVSG